MLICGVFEKVPLKKRSEEYFKEEVLPPLTDAWIDHGKTKTGYEINFTKYFYQYKPLHGLEEISREIRKLEEETEDMIKKIIE